MYSAKENPDKPGQWLVIRDEDEVIFGRHVDSDDKSAKEFAIEQVKALESRAARV